MTRSADLWEAYTRAPGSSSLEEIQAVNALRAYAVELEQSLLCARRMLLDAWVSAMPEMRHSENADQQRRQIAEEQGWDPAELWPDQDVASLLCRDHESGGGRSE